MSLKEKIVVFYHLCPINNWEEIFEEQMNLLIESELIDAAEFVHVGINGDVIPNFKHKKIRYVINNDWHLEEAPTLKSLLFFADKNPGYKILYLHSKGVTRVDHKGVTLWRQLMDHHCIYHWKKAISFLPHWDAVGCNLTSHPRVHFSGNFWWSTSDYIKTLSHEMLWSQDRYDKEFYIGSKNGKFLSLFNSDVDHYSIEFEKDLWVYYPEPWSFGITTIYENKERLLDIITSIRALNIPKYEILLIGGGDSSGIEGNDIVKIDFDENEKPMWITRKKNILAQKAKYNNLVIMHDYHIFDSGWYNGFEQFGYDWDICSNPQYLINGQRNPMDWSLWDKPGHGRAWSLDYDNWSETQFMYISGGYFIVKKNVLLEEPLNEDLVWNQEEDVEWSLRVRNKYVMKCNKDSVVRHNKWHRHAG